jgi:phage shock protein C
VRTLPCLRTVVIMRPLFDSLRRLGFRRGPRRLAAGIAGGIAQRIGISVWLVRVLLLASFLLPVLGFGAYLVAWLLLPWQDGSIPLERLFGGRRGRPDGPDLG